MILKKQECFDIEKTGVLLGITYQSTRMSRRSNKRDVTPFRRDATPPPSLARHDLSRDDSELNLGTLVKDDDSVNSGGSVNTSKSSNRRSGNIHDERVGISELGSNVFTYVTSTQSSKFLRTRKKVAEFVSMKHGPEQFELVMFGEEPAFTEPSKPVEETKGAGITALQELDYKLDREEYLRKKEEFRKEKASTFMVVQGQCVQTLRNALEAKPEYPKVRKDRDVKKLMEMIETLVHGTERTQNKNWRLYKQTRKLYTIIQDKGEPEASFGNRYLAQAESVEKCGGVLMSAEGAKETDPDKRLAAREEYLACGILAQARRSVHSKSLAYLETEFFGTPSRDLYPKTAAKAVEFLAKRRTISEAEKQADRQLQFAQGDGIHCYGCGMRGYTKADCPNCRKGTVKDKKRGKKSESIFQD